MAKKTPPRTRHRRRRALTLKLSGPGVRTGRITVPDLLVLCREVQTAVSRQAEALEGKRSVRPGRRTEKVRLECTLELVSLRQGSTSLGFDLAKSQASLPIGATFGEKVISKVASTIQSVAEGHEEEADAGVLASLNSLGDILNQRVTSIRWIVPRQNGRKGIDTVYNKRVRSKIAERLQPALKKPIEIEGVVEMADFKPQDQKCRIHPPLGPPVPCVFERELEDRVYEVLRRPARIQGEATVNSQSGRTESVSIRSVTPLEPLAVGAESFVAGHSFDELVRLQAVEPLQDPSLLAGGWSEDDDLDQALADIYAERQ